MTTFVILLAKFRLQRGQKKVRQLLMWSADEYQRTHSHRHNPGDSMNYNGLAISEVGVCIAVTKYPRRSIAKKNQVLLRSHGWALKIQNSSWVGLATCEEESRKLIQLVATVAIATACTYTLWLQPDKGLLIKSLTSITLQIMLRYPRRFVAHLNQLQSLLASHLNDAREVHLKAMKDAVTKMGQRPTAYPSWLGESNACHGCEGGDFASNDTGSDQGDVCQCKTIKNCNRMCKDNTSSNHEHVAALAHRAIRASSFPSLYWLLLYLYLAMKDLIPKERAVNLSAIQVGTGIRL